MILALGVDETPWFVSLFLALAVAVSIVWMWIELEYLTKAFQGIRHGILRRLFHWYR